MELYQHSLSATYVFVSLLPEKQKGGHTGAVPGAEMRWQISLEIHRHSDLSEDGPGAASSADSFRGAFILPKACHLGPASG